MRLVQRALLAHLVLQDPPDMGHRVFKVVPVLPVRLDLLDQPVRREHKVLRDHLASLVLRVLADREQARKAHRESLERLEQLAQWERLASKEVPV